VVYEGFAPHKVPVIVECLTDNKNRTASNIRVLFRKGQIGSMGSVQWMFDRVGVIEAVAPQAEVDLEEAAIEAGAQDVEALEEFELQQDQKGGRFFTEPADLDVVNKALSDAGWVISFSELSYRPKTPVSISEDQKKEVEDFLGNVDVDDDVHRVYVAL
jgi:transcriptional/translational regulatory protein YebC/TACO1